MTTTTPAAEALHKPYVGPIPVPASRTLYGRTRELDDLLDLVIAERIVLLYSPSGAGKTSLIQAALVPRLEEERFHVLPVMLARLLPPPDRALPRFNRYVLSLLMSLDEGLEQSRRTPLETLAGLRLTDYLAQRPVPEGAPANQVLIFDQFEDVLTLDPTDREDKEELFEQVGQALRSRQRWALFAMREEFRAGLDPFLRHIPGRLAATYRLDLLGVDAALDAIRKPVAEIGGHFEEKAARQLIDDLRKVKVQRAGTRPEELPGLYVEPVQLQVVCLRLWEKLPAGTLRIGKDDIKAVEDVDSALAGHYDDKLLAAARAPGLSVHQAIRRERILREWFGNRLITEHGFRAQVPRDPEAKDGLDEATLRKLVDAHLIREEQRRGVTWYELPHDRLIEPVRRSNAAWLEEHLGPLQRQAALWAGKKSGYLLQDEGLKEAEVWAQEHADELTETEQSYLEACQKAHQTLVRERRTARRIRLLAWVASAAAVLSLVLAGIAGVAWQQASAAKEREAKANAQLAKANKRQAELNEKLAEVNKQLAGLVGRRVQAIGWEAPLIEKELNISDEKGRSERSGETVTAPDVQRVNTIFEADDRFNALALDSGPAAREAVTIRYFARELDRNEIESALRQLGFTLDPRASNRFDPTNAVWFGSEVPIESVRLVAYTLVRAGIGIKSIRPVRDPAKARIVQVGASSRNVGRPNLTLEQIDGLTPAGL